MAESTEIGALLQALSSRLEAVSESPRLDAEILLGRAIDMPRSYLFAHPEDSPDAAALARLEETVQRRLAGEPMAYITGTREFWSLELLVSPATLVPRPETELLVDLALRHLPRDAELRVLDLGTGSGAIALAIAKERPMASIVAVDQSAAALAVAEQNARQLLLTNLRFVHGDWTAPVRNELFDMIVSNPPYVREDDAALEKLGSEPRAALVSGSDGLDAIRALATSCGDVLRAGGFLMLEHGAEQQREVSTILQKSGWIETACHKDYAGLPRVTTAQSRTEHAPAAEL